MWRQSYVNSLAKFIEAMNKNVCGKKKVDRWRILYWIKGKSIWSLELTIWSCFKKIRQRCITNGYTNLFWRTDEAANKGKPVNLILQSKISKIGKQRFVLIVLVFKRYTVSCGELSRWLSYQISISLYMYLCYKIPYQPCQFQWKPI